MRNIEEIHNDIRKTKRGLRNARRKKEQCEQKLKERRIYRSDDRTVKHLRSR